MAPTLQDILLKSLRTDLQLARTLLSFPQLVLAVPIAGGILMALAATTGLNPFDTSSPARVGATVSLTLSHYIWTIIFDYVNACQDTTDDVRAGVRSMAVRYQNTSTFIAALGTGQVACLVLVGFLAKLSPVYFLFAVGGNTACLVSIILNPSGIPRLKISGRTCSNSFRHAFASLDYWQRFNHHDLTNYFFSLL